MPRTSQQRQSARPKVFVSYSHDSEDHLNHVLALADKLREHGVDCQIDQYEHWPNEGWIPWMLQQFEEADYILAVCTKEYRKRFELDRPGLEGRGVKFEGAIITKRLYDKKLKNSNIIPILLRSSDQEHIPTVLAAPNYSFCDLSTQPGYEKLLRLIFDKPEIEPREPGTPPTLPVRDRRLDFFSFMDSGTPKEPEAAHASQGTETVEIRIHMPFGEFDERTENLLQFGLAKFLDIPSTAVVIKTILPGSVRVSVVLPRQAAEKLLHAYRFEAEDLREALNGLEVAAIVLKDPHVEQETQDGFAVRTRTLRKPRLKAEPRKLLEKHTTLKRLFREEATHASVLFADMIASTAFKEHPGALEAFEKPYEHHLTVCKIVEQKQHGGKVIKSLGDGVMVMFDGDDCEQRAISAGLAVLEELRRRNATHKGKNDDAAILTRIGIHTGPVWTFKFPESKVADPQGTTVDVAARLCALAEAEQLLCTDEETFQVAGGEEVFRNSSKASWQFLKGVSGRLSMRVVLPDAEGWVPTHVPLSGYRSPIRPGLKEQLDQACALFLSGDRESLSQAYDAFASIVEQDPGSFEARLGLSSIMLMSDSASLEFAEGLEALRDHLAVATQGSPLYSRVWLLVGLARLKRFELHGQDVADLDLAFVHTEAALDLASQDLDVPGVLECKLQLARILLIRALRAGPDGGANDLSAAASLCADVAPILHGHLERTRLAFVLTDASVRLAQAGTLEELDKIEEAFEAVLKEESKNPAVLHALGDLYAKRKRLNAG